MKKYLSILLVSLLALSSCSDDKVHIPKLNKLTKITCYVNDDTNAAYTANISYMSDGQIVNMQKGGYNYQFTYVSNILTVSDNTSAKTEYIFNKNKIGSKKIYEQNPQANNEIYISNEYQYNYTGSSLYSADWTTRWPGESGTGYESRYYKNAESYVWQGGNIVRFAQNEEEMTYEYSTQKQPTNFPFRVINSLNPTNFDFISPINLLFGTMNTYLPQRAYWYNVKNPGVINAEYTFTYNVVGEYVTNMTIEEKNHVAEDGYNTYKYIFEYIFEEK